MLPSIRHRLLRLTRDLFVAASRKAPILLTIAQAIDDDLANFAALRSKPAAAVNTKFGSGRAWLGLTDGELSVLSTLDADNPMLSGRRRIDVWERAYHVDCKNRRTGYIDAVTDGLLNWQFVLSNFERS